jgi:hypothetical protein
MCVLGGSRFCHSIVNCTAAHKSRRALRLFAEGSTTLHASPGKVVTIALRSRDKDDLSHG